VYTRPPRGSPSLHFSWRAVLLRHCEGHWQCLQWRRWRLNIPLCSCALSWRGQSISVQWWAGQLLCPDKRFSAVYLATN